MNFLTNNLNYNQNQAENMVLHNLVGAPLNPAPGQIYYDSTTSKQRAYYFSPTAGGVGVPGWILIDNPTVDVDNYVDGLLFNSTSGILTLERTNALTDLTINLDGRYLTGNENITLSGHVTGSGTTSITTSLHSSAITSQSDATVGTDGQPTGVSYFLIAQDGNLRKYSWSDLEDSITQNNVTSFTSSTSSGANSVIVSHDLDAGTIFETDVTFEGTTSEIEVTTPSNNNVKIGLPDNVNITQNLVVGGDLTVQGSTTTLNTNELKIEDNIITLNSGTTGTPTMNAGIEVERGTSVDTAIRWNESTDRWQFTNNGTTYYNIPIPSEYNSYVHPTQAAITVDGSGLQFIQDLTVNTLGHVTSAVLGTIPSASETQLGVVEFATNAEHLAGTSTTIATNPLGVKNMIDAAISAAGTSSVYKTTISPTNNSTTTVTHNLGTTDIMVELHDVSTGEIVWARVIKNGNNTITISVGNLGTVTDIRVLIRTV